MSRIDELKKQHPIYALSAIDIYKMISPNQSNKYIEMLIKLDKTKEFNEPNAYRREIIEYMAGWGIDYNYLETLDLETLNMLFLSANNLIGEQGKIRLFTKFASFIERKLIENNDVTSYSSWSEIEQAVALADVKLIDKTLEKQIKKVYEDDTWISLRPLSLEASMKYGANTKWCTTTESGQYYARYTSRGILIYNINKKTGYKVACFKNLDPNHDNEFSWWDVTDRRIEALDSEAPSAVLEAIRNEIKEMPVPNQTLMTQEESDKLEMYKDGNYRPGMYEEGPGIDNAHRSGGLTHSGTSNTLVFNPSTHTTSYPYPLTINTSHSVGIGTINPTTQLSVNGDMAIEGNIRFTSEGVERARLTSEGNLITFGPDGQQYINGVLEHLNPENYNREQLIQELNREWNGGDVTEPIPQKQQTGVDLQHLYNELNEVRFDRDEPAEDARWRLEQTMASQMAEANERVAQKHLSLLDNIELGTLDNDIKIKMQMLAGIKNTKQQIQELEADIERLRSEEAQPEVVHLSLWNKIKNTGIKLGKRFTSRSRKQVGVSMKNEYANAEAESRKIV
jgi:hypothetical protein